MQINYCKVCLYPETKPDLGFDENGVCTACLAAEEKNTGIDWAQRADEFNELVVGKWIIMLSCFQKQIVKL